MRHLITGTGRCGTTATYNVLRGINIDAGIQERRMGEQAGVAAMGYLHHFPEDQWDVTHAQLRRPEACISSLHTTKNPFNLAFLHSRYNFPYPKKALTRLHSCMLYYAYGNNYVIEMANQTGGTVFHAEDEIATFIHTTFKDVLTVSHPLIETLVRVNSLANTRSNRPTYTKITKADMFNAHPELAEICYRIYFAKEAIG